MDCSTVLAWMAVFLLSIPTSHGQTTEPDGIESLIIGQAMMYRVQQLACSGVTYRFTCDRPHYTIQVGRGMNWGVMANLTQTLVGEQCRYSVNDCYVHEAENAFLNSLYERCERRNTCTFYVPSIPVSQCDGRISHYAFILLNCKVGESLDEASPITNPPSGIVSVNISSLTTNNAATTPNPFNTPPIPTDYSDDPVNSGSTTSPRSAITSPTSAEPNGEGGGGSDSSVEGGDSGENESSGATTTQSGANGGPGQAGSGEGGSGGVTNSNSGGDSSTTASTNGGSGNSGAPDGGDGGSPGDVSQTGGDGGAGYEPGNLVQTTQLITGPPRDPKNDTVLYKVQAAYCSGSTYSFSCDKPEHVMWVGRGLVWGTKHTAAPNNETCMPREGDCQYAEQDNQLLDLLMKRCNYRSSCWFEIPEVMINGCNTTSDWVFLLFKCGVSFNWKPPPLVTPPGVLSTISRTVKTTSIIPTSQTPTTVTPITVPTVATDGPQGPATPATTINLPQPPTEEPQPPTVGPDFSSTAVNPTNPVTNIQDRTFSPSIPTSPTAAPQIGRTTLSTHPAEKTVTTVAGATNVNGGSTVSANPPSRATTLRSTAVPTLPSSTPSGNQVTGSTTTIHNGGDSLAPDLTTLISQTSTVSNSARQNTGNPDGVTPFTGQTVSDSNQDGGVTTVGTTKDTTSIASTEPTITDNSGPTDHTFVTSRTSTVVSPSESVTERTGHGDVTTTPSSGTGTSNNGNPGQETSIPGNTSPNAATTRSGSGTNAETSSVSQTPVAVDTATTAEQKTTKSPGNNGGTVTITHTNYVNNISMASESTSLHPETNTPTAKPGIPPSQTTSNTDSSVFTSNPPNAISSNTQYTAITTKVTNQSTHTPSTQKETVNTDTQVPTTDRASSAIPSRGGVSTSEPTGAALSTKSTTPAGNEATNITTDNLSGTATNSAPQTTFRPTTKPRSVSTRSATGSESSLTSRDTSGYNTSTMNNLVTSQSSDTSIASSITTASISPTPSGNGNTTSDSEPGFTERQVTDAVPQWVWIVVGISIFLFILVILLLVIICYWNDYHKHRKRKDKYNRPRAERHFEGAASLSQAAAGVYDSIDAEADDTDSMGTAGSTGRILRR